ncbi:Cilia- and flagella-associated protein 43, partial [Nowakowskiella sp. JEL0078]
MNEGVVDYSQIDSKGLLYDSFELTTNERKITQIHLLGEVILDIKTAFNEKFREFEKLKGDEISKIEDKNDRINQIMQELQIQETLFRPYLDEDEVPERIITVNDSEVTIEKVLIEEVEGVNLINLNKQYITADEKKKIEEKQKLDEERLRAAQEDNFRERALLTMMGGRLEDRSEQEDKEELVKPDWMSKPKEELNEEERKQIKEFEKKLAEEQEKYKKALETELKKLQGVITEICENFDQQLQQFANFKLATDQS